MLWFSKQRWRARKTRLPLRSVSGATCTLLLRLPDFPMTTEAELQLITRISLDQSECGFRHVGVRHGASAGASAVVPPLSRAALGQSEPKRIDCRDADLLRVLLQRANFIGTDE